MLEETRCEKSNGNYLVINGGKPLKGELRVNGAKNAALPIMAGAILAPGNITLERVPDISDVRVMTQLLRHLGATVESDNNVVSIDTQDINNTKAPYSLVKKLNASFDITGALVARFGEATVPLPGGCVIGTRAVDLHLAGFEALGCKVEQLSGGFIQIRAETLMGTRFYFSKTSVGATKNVMMAACLARGKTILENVAREPEVVDLANFLNTCGAQIAGHGTARIEIRGVKQMIGNGIEYSIIPDRIEAGTYILAAAVTGGKLKLIDISPDYLKIFLRKLRKANQEVITGENFIEVRGRKPIHPMGAVITEPYPGFPTDLQPPVVAFLCLEKGVSYVKEKIFNMRFNYVNELRRMGADIELDGRTAIVRGVKELLGAPVDAPDIRAGGALIIAALAARGNSEIHGMQYIDRGYENIENRLGNLGADIRRVK
ncbi:MAG: UDP-N-acetylglucosamine 1-carboxyvinyltransferase [Vulcanimicrobiota bacterium]